MKIKILLLSFSLTLIAQTAFSQKEKNKEDNKVKANFSGFFKYDAWYDSRKNAEALDGLFTMYPLNELPDSAGNDINAASSVNMLAITTRLNTNIFGPEVFNAKTSVFIEADFSGVSGSISHFRFRHAFAKLKWANTEVLAGRFWHPLFVTEVFPTVMSLNTGVPFQVFNRSPQLRISHNIDKIKLIGSAIYQADYKSTGPNGRSSEYLKYAKIPNLNLRVQHNTKTSVLGIGVDYKQLKPQQYSESLIDSGYIYKSDNSVEGLTIMGYGKVQLNKITLKAKAMKGQNLYEHLLPGGYAVSGVDSATGEKTFSPSNNIYAWGNIIYGNKLKVGLMAGYMKNKGFSKNIYDEIYSRASNIDYIYRISPHISYKAKNILLGLELENTAAAYGKINHQDNGIVTNSEEIYNHRLLFTLFYFF